MAISKIEIIVSAFHVGMLEHQVGAGPGFILKQGLEAKLRAAGKEVSVNVIDTLSEDKYVGDVGRSFEVMRRVSAAVSAAKAAGAFPVVLAGNCNNTVGVAAGLGLGGDSGDVVWFDAHPDFDTPEEQTMGYFDCNGVALLGGQCWAALRRTIPGHAPLDLAKTFTYVGLRDFDENVYPRKITAAGIRTVWAGKDTPQRGFAAELDALLGVGVAHERKGRDTIVHFDVDSLDISVGVSNFAASTGGLSKQDALECAKVVKSHRKPVGLTVASFDPSYENPEGVANAAIAVILELVG